VAGVTLMRAAFFFLALFLVPTLGISPDARAQDVIVVNPKKSENDLRFKYPFVVLKEAFKRTEDQYGQAIFRRYPAQIPRARALDQLVKGALTIFVAPTRKEWEERTLPVRIPIRKGLLGYRLLLINQQDQTRIAKVSDIDALKKLVLGGGAQWSTTAALRKLGFTVEGGSEYESLFSMLEFRRFDVFPRGVNEIFGEFDSRKDKFPNMRIEKHLALYQPLPTYFFVSPKRPDLVKRLEEGLKQMIADGTLDRLFHAHHGKALERANIGSRRIISIPNPDLTPQTPFAQENLWYKPAKR
jgi:hypothetical protein